jgi:hypothetical protein
MCGLHCCLADRSADSTCRQTVAPSCAHGPVFLTLLDSEKAWQSPPSCFVIVLGFLSLSFLVYSLVWNIQTHTTLGG